MAENHRERDLLDPIEREVLSLSAKLKPRDSSLVYTAPDPDFSSLEQLRLLPLACD